MKLYVANLVNAVLLIALGAWAYFTSATPSVTTLIPVIAGIILFALQTGIKKGAKTFIYIGLALTAVILLGLVKPLMGALDRESTLALVRVVLMMLSSVIALFYFIKKVWK